jgi:hypothetical protein
MHTAEFKLGTASRDDSMLPFARLNFKGALRFTTRHPVSRITNNVQGINVEYQVG